MSQKNNQKDKSVVRPVLKNETWILLGIFLFSFLLYGNTLNHGYVLDDELVIWGNKFVQEGLEGIPEIFGHSYLYGFKGIEDRSYRPISLLLFAIEKQLFGAKPSVHHFFNIFYYALLGVFLFRLLSKLFESRTVFLPFLICLLYISHPIHTEVVANIKSRDEILAMLFLILTLYSCLRSYKNSRFAAMPMVYFVLSVLSKEIGFATLPLIPLTLFVYTKLKMKDIVKRVIPFAVLTSGVFVIRYLVTDSSADDSLSVINNSLVGAENALERFASAIMILGKYIYLLFLPLNLTYDYSFNQIKLVGLTSPKFLMSIVTLSALGIYAGIKIKSRNIYAYAILFFFVTIILVSNLITLIGSTMAERFLFIPSLAFVLIIVHLIFKVLKIENNYISDSKKLPLFIISGVILIFYSFKTIDRNKDWKSNETLWNSATDISRNSARLHNHLGNSYRKKFMFSKGELESKENFKLAVKHYTKSIDIYPNYINSQFNLGLMFDLINEYERAIGQYRIVLNINPHHELASLNTGVIYSKKGLPKKAVQFYEKVIQVNPFSSDAYSNLGADFYTIGSYEQAISHWDKAIELNPENLIALNNLIRYYKKKGDTERLRYYETKARGLPKKRDKLGSSY